MKKLFVVLVFILSLLLLEISPVQAGGWAVLTLQNWPGEVTAGEPFTIEYALRQHGVHLVPHDPAWHTPTITAVHNESGETIDFEVEGMPEDGYYRAEMLLPEPGSWQWSIDAFGRFHMPPLTAVAATAVPSESSVLAQLPTFALTLPWLLGIVGLVTMLAGLFYWFGRKARYAPLLGLAGVGLCLGGFWLLPANQVATAVAESSSAPSAEMGEILFVSKGCVSCHTHGEVFYQGIRTNIGPNLTEYEAGEEFLQLWLRNPSEVRPDTRMPNLGLADDEIQALIAFLRQTAPATTRDQK